MPSQREGASEAPPWGVWGAIGFVEGHGNSNSQKNYSFIDKNLSVGVVTYRLKQIDNDGKFSYSAEINVKVENIPTEFALFQNYPNPFNPETFISFQIPVAGHVSLKIYDLLGNEISTLVNKETEAGSYRLKFDGSKLSSGVYFYRLTAGSFMAAKKFILTK